MPAPYPLFSVSASVLLLLLGIWDSTQTYMAWWVHGLHELGCFSCPPAVNLSSFPYCLALLAGPACDCLRGCSSSSLHSMHTGHAHVCKAIGSIPTPCILSKSGWTSILSQISQHQHA